MAQDFAKRSKSRKKKKPPPSRFSLGSFVVGVITGVGLFLLGAYGPELLSPAEAPAGAPAQAQTSAPTGTPAEASTNPPELAELSEDTANLSDETQTALEFEFRDLLGTDQVDPDISAYEAAVKLEQAKGPQQPTHYLLQSGSFQIKADAETRRGTLLLLNMPANIVEAQINNKTWYRVIVGPYPQRGLAQQAASKLRARDIRSIWMERPVTSG